MPFAEEIIVRDASDADVASVHAYLAAKYGL